MQLERLLNDVVQLPPGASQRQKHIRLAQMLNERYAEGSAENLNEAAISEKGVSKWFERGSIPAPWLLRIAMLPKRPLNLSNYA